MPRIPRRFLPLALVFAVLVLFMPRTAKFNYDYRKGSPWPYETLVSQFDFPILKTEEQLLEELDKVDGGTVPYYRYSEDVVNSAAKSVQSVDLGKYARLRPAIASGIADIYAKGVISDAKEKLDRGYGILSDEVIYIQRNKRAAGYPRSEVYKVSDAKNRLLADVSRSYPDVNLDSLFKRSGVYDLIIPNLVFDRTMTELSHAESAAYVSPTSGYWSAEQRIVSTGDIVTPEIAQILDSYKAEYNKIYGYEGPRILLWLGNILIALTLLVILYFCVFFADRDIFRKPGRYYYLLTVFALTAVIAFLVERFAPSRAYLVPFTVVVLFLLAFFPKHVVLPVYTVSLLPLLIFSGNGVELFCIFLCAGTVSLNTFKYFNRGWRQFVNALIIFGVELVVFFGFRLIDAGRSLLWYNVLYLFIGSMLTVALYPLIFLFEGVFNLVSTTRLVDLADTNRKLLRELNAKAPGTFQHSLQVMNMADEAGHSVHANVPLLRAAALYHDLGKMRNPLCFIENSSRTPGSPNYHDGKSPRESARDIIAHVQDGLEIARENRLPTEVSDFILTHHGTSFTASFYNQYLNEGGNPDDVDDFFYKGRKPRTKEEVILMICDSVEAASRTLKEYTPASFDKFVEDMVAAKEKSGQFAEAEITIRELNIVKARLKTYLQQLYHERIEYTKREGE
jgi:putative nucleotidyltransferase with HDIG domain